MPKIKSILLVDDDANDIELAVEALKRNNLTNHIVTARHGGEALDYLFGTGAHEGRDTSILPAMVLLDLKLPKINGVEVLRRIRADERTRLLPVVMLTTSVEEQDVLASYAHGVNSYVQKPVNFERFSEAVRQLGLYWLLLNVHPSIET